MKYCCSLCTTYKRFTRLQVSLTCTRAHLSDMTQFVTFGMKVVLVLLSGLLCAESARLLRIPRIYNALITTDEELVPSQAYPAVAPVLRPAIPHLSYIYYNESDYGAPQPPFYPGQIPSGPGAVPDLPQEPGTATGRQQQNPPPVYSLQAQEREPVFDNQVKNNRNPLIPDVPPPPLPVKPPSSSKDGAKRPPQDYPPPPPVPIF